MGIEVQLRRESGEVLATVSDPQMVLSRAASLVFDDTRLFKYMVPWGNAVFNHSQAADLQDDIRQLQAIHAGTPLGKILDAMVPLVDRLAKETHVYLWFMGD